jgi:hypothetical protein
MLLKYIYTYSSGHHYFEALAPITDPRLLYMALSAARPYTPSLNDTLARALGTAIAAEASNVDFTRAPAALALLASPFLSDHIVWFVKDHQYALRFAALIGLVELEAAGHEGVRAALRGGAAERLLRALARSREAMYILLHAMIHKCPDQGCTSEVRSFFSALIAMPLCFAFPMLIYTVCIYVFCTRAAMQLSCTDLYLLSQC